jgi:hypothetical protein
LTRFDELKTLKSIEKQTLFLFFHDFWKIKKNIEKINSFGANFGAILTPFSISGAPKTLLFARLLSQGTCRYTHPKKQPKEKMM